MEILLEAEKIEEGKTYDLSNKIVASLFFETSTRTQYSFLTAMAKLKIKELNFNPVGSSLSKGESFYDTVKTFESLGVDAFVIRHSEDEYYKQLKNIKVPIINGGDGSKDHPTQSLLDLYTIYQEFKNFQGLKIAIVGDIKHSRVAHTNIEVMKRLGMEVKLSGPKEFWEEGYDFLALEEVLPKVDIVMLLRVQNERHQSLFKLSNAEYLEKYGLTMAKVNIMKKNAIIMHPAPFNRGVEIADDVVECPKSRIFKQMANGVFIRQAVLKRSLINE
ncbi:MAG: aspartate carbamoyltransferase catalytic subunit [Erysipelotrichales bacterium]|nr:aspartate carbamoyltransferase catalytic subunit [Erysipelotrichales bacterium]